MRRQHSKRSSAKHFRRHSGVKKVNHRPSMLGRRGGIRL